MKVTLHLSGGLRALLTNLPEEVTIHLDEPMRLESILVLAGINPSLVAALLVNGQRVDKEEFVNEDAQVSVVGPLAGG